MSLVATTGRNWQPRRGGRTAENVLELPRLESLTLVVVLDQVVACWLCLIPEYAARPIVALPQIFTLGPGKSLRPGYKIYHGFCA